ncbi:MAG: hypothetical protein MI919_11895, partial [Holophagales bacterium]|nr:hypothetical protein [Holophagales bacterium]
MLLLLALLAPLRAPLERVWGDEGTFLAMTESLVRDGDLLFDERDEARVLAYLEAEPENRGRGALILERTAKGIAYSKPIVLALSASPFFALFGETGLIVLNGLAFAAALWVAYGVLSRLEGSRPEGPRAGRAAWTLATFACAAAVVPYAFWRMADLLQLSFALAGLLLALDRHPHHRWSPWIGTALVAMTIPMRLSNLALAGIPVLAALFERRWRVAAGRALVVVVTAGALAGITYLLTGAPDPYRAERTSFFPASGYPAGDDAEAVAERFSAVPASHRATPGGPLEVAYASLYFLLGRHSGLIAYFPAALVFLWLALRRSDAKARAALLGLGASVAFFLVLKPENYFGGETFLGNRYFLPLYPALLAALPRLPSARALAVAWGIALLSLGSAAVSIARHHELDQRSQSHVHAGLFRLLPYESTARGLDGRRDRYWSAQMVRFLDPFARVERERFELTAGRPPAEMMVVCWQDPGPLRFLVQTDAENAHLHVHDWRGKRTYKVGRELVTQGGFVGIDVETAPSWRYHRFWFEDQIYWARLLRLELEAEAGSTARVVHLGDPSVLARSFAYELLDAQVPATAVPKGESGISLRVRNTSRNIWAHRDSTAVTARYRLWRDGELLAESQRTFNPRAGLREIPPEV